MHTYFHVFLKVLFVMYLNMLEFQLWPRVGQTNLFHVTSLKLKSITVCLTINFERLQQNWTSFDQQLLLCIYVPNRFGKMICKMLFRNDLYCKRFQKAQNHFTCFCRKITWYFLQVISESLLLLGNKFTLLTLYICIIECHDIFFTSSFLVARNLYSFQQSLINQLSYSCST